MKNLKYSDFLQRTKLNDSEIINLYQYGSRVYGNFTARSDYDFICILRNKTSEQFSDNLINVNFYSKEEHQHRLNVQEISALECQFLNPKYIWKEFTKFHYQLNLPQLRCSLSEKSSNSWVKAKKKLTVEKDYDLDIGRKSLWHSIRIIRFGIQIAQNGKIINYQECNSLYGEIMNYYQWEELFEHYKKKYNEILSEFRILAPKI